MQLHLLSKHRPQYKTPREEGQDQVVLSLLFQPDSHLVVMRLVVGS